MPVPGVELLAGAAISYVLRKLRRVGGRADVVVDQVIDQGADAVDDLVARKLGRDQALERLREQAADGSEIERTVRRAADAVADALDDDPEFARQLKALVGQLQSYEASQAMAQSTSGGVHAGHDVHQHAETGGVITADVHGPITVTPPNATPAEAQHGDGSVGPTQPASET